MVDITIKEELIFKWAQDNAQWKAVLNSELFRKEEEDAWAYLSEQCPVVYSMEKELFCKIWREAMVIEFAGELFERFLAEENGWETSTVDDEWLHERAKKLRECVMEEFGPLTVIVGI